MLGYACRSGVLNLLGRDKSTVIQHKDVYIEGCEHHSDMDMLIDNIHIDYGMSQYDPSDFNILVAHGMLLPSAAFPFISCVDPNLEKKKKDAKNKNKSIVYCTTIDDILNNSQDNKPDLILSGHYHDGFEVKKKNTVFLNPGSFGRNSICKRSVFYYVINIINGSLIYQLEEINSALPYQKVFDFSANASNSQTAATLKGYSKKLSQSIRNARDLNDIISDIAEEENLNDDMKALAREHVEKAKLTMIKDSNDLMFKGYKEEPSNIMIKRVKIINFQSYKDQVIEFEDGLNIIVGASHKGKTAAIRALDWVFEDTPKGAGFIRAGAKSCSVEVEFSNGKKIRRTRTLSNTGKYIVFDNGNEMEYEKFKEIPIDILNATQIPSITFTKNYTATPNIALQHDAPFFIGASGYDRAAVLGHLIDIDPVDLAITDIRRSIIAKNKEVKSKTHDLDTTIDHLKQYANLGTYRREILEYKALYAALKENNGKLKELQELFEKLGTAHKALKQHKSRLLNYFDTDKARALISMSEVNIKSHGQLEYEMDNLKTLFRQRDILKSKRYIDKNTGDIIADSEEKINLFKRLSDTQVKLTALHDNLSQTKKALNKINSDQSRYETEYNNIFDSLDVCPVCDRPI
jgi:DNA repair exonuclease SbcCD nuclease subunit